MVGSAHRTISTQLDAGLLYSENMQMHPQKLRALLNSVRSKKSSVEAALTELASLPFSDIDIAKVDHHRALRCGFAEVVFGSGKTPEDILRILENGLKHAPCLLVTRTSETQAATVLKKYPTAIYNPRGRTVRVGK